MAREWLTSSSFPRQRKTKCHQKEGQGSLRQSEVFFPLTDYAIIAHNVVPPGICSGHSRGFSLCHPSSSSPMQGGGRQHHCLRR